LEMARVPTAAALAAAAAEEEAEAEEEEGKEEEVQEEEEEDVIEAVGEAKAQDSVQLVKATGSGAEGGARGAATAAGATPCSITRHTRRCVWRCSPCSASSAAISSEVAPHT